MAAGGTTIAAERVEAAAGIERRVASECVAYLAVALAQLGTLPTKQTLVVERFFDDAGGAQLVVHSPYGARINRGLGLALRKRFCRTFDFELQAAASDDAIVLSLGPQHSFGLESVLRFLSPENVRETLIQAVLPTPIFTSRWRWNLGRSLVSPRFRGARHLPPAIQRMEADDLMDLPDARRVPGKRHRPDRGPRPPSRPPDDRRLHDRSDGPRRVDRAARRPARRVGERRHARHDRAVDPHPRDLERATVHVLGRRAARGTSHASGRAEPRGADSRRATCR